MIEATAVNLRFTAHYYAHMDMGFDRQIYQFAHSPSWFAVGSPWVRHPGYGFAADARVDLTYPHRDPAFSGLGDGYKRFSWQLSSGESARCLHLFMRGREPSFDSRIGHAWYEFIYKPIEAAMPGRF